MAERRNTQRVVRCAAEKYCITTGVLSSNCIVRNLSDSGACLQVESVVGVPPEFDLLVDGEVEGRPCKIAWQAQHQIGVAFSRAQWELGRDEQPGGAESMLRSKEIDPAQRPNDLLPYELLRLRAALDEITFGVVLLDHELCAQFINRAYRKMWRLPDAKAENKPPFVALMYHGRDTRAYAMPPAALDAYVAERVAQVKAGDAIPRDIRLANGEVLRFQCTVLPAGGRMLSYTYVTDIVRHSDELEVLRAALDNVEQGIILLDSQFNAQFMNRAVRRLFGVPNEQAERKPPYTELVNDSRFTKAYGVPPDELEAFISRRIAAVKANDPTPFDFRVKDGRTIRSQCTKLPDGRRMLTYTDVSDLVRNAEELTRLATIDGMTDVYNRRHFQALADTEWGRFQRYHRPLSLAVLDIDYFKAINDRFGHDAGDRALAHVCHLCGETKRSSDILGRIGGDEFAVLLPETDLAQAQTVAERMRHIVQKTPLPIDGTAVAMTISIGVAEATLSQSSVNALMKLADRSLYDAKAAGRNRIAHAIDKPIAGYKTAAE